MANLAEGIERRCPEQLHPMWPMREPRWKAWLGFSGAILAVIPAACSVGPDYLRPSAAFALASIGPRGISPLTDAYHAAKAYSPPRDDIESALRRTPTTSPGK